MKNTISQILIMGSLVALTACGGGGGSTPEPAPTNTAPSFTSATSANVAENSSTVITITATDADGDALTFSLSGGNDQSKFSINSTSGALSFTSAPNFETPTDSNADNIYSVVVSVSDGTDSASQTVSVTVTNVNEFSPFVTSNSSVNVAENSTSIFTVTGSDDDGDTISFSLTGGADQAKFSINSSSGALSFIAAPDFETPTDNDTNNIYEVFVTVSDGSLSSSQTVFVTVTDIVDETGPIISSVSPLDAATAVSSSTTIQAVFNENLDCASVTSSTFTLVSSAASVAGTVTCSNNTATFTPSASLVQDSFTATLTVGITDTTGNPLSSQYQWSFSTQTWTQTLGVAGFFANARASTTDSLDNVYIAGTTNGALDGQTLAGNNDVFISKFNSSGIKQWTRQLGTTAFDYGYAIAADSADNIYVAGSTGAALNAQTAVGGDDIFVAKYNSSGTIQWTQQLGTTSYDRVRAITIDGSNNVYIAGETGGSLDGQTSAGNNDLFVTKYNSSGVKQWTRQLGTSWTDIAFGITSDSAGNVYVSGWEQDALDGQTSAGNYDLFVTKYDTNGVKQWTRQIGTAGIDKAYAIDSDSAGNIYISGVTAGNLDGQTLAGINDMFIVKYNSSGVKQWTRLLGATGALVTAFSITVDSSDNIYAAGKTNSSLDGQTLIGNSDLFVTKYDVNGTKSWTRQTGATSNNTQANAISTDSNDNVYVSGQTYGNLDGNTLIGTSDAFIIKYSSAGVKQ